MEKYIKKLKQRLTTGYVSTLPNGVKGFVVYYGISRVELRCVLMQYQKAMDYASSKLKKHERNYLAFNLELAAIVFVLKIWHH